jgi:hypothetical protein
MFYHMRTRTTLILPENLMRALKRRAAERGQTLSDVVAETLQMGLARIDDEGVLTPLPTYAMGKPQVDLSDRDRLYDVMEED